MPTKIEKDIVTGQETTGHEWDGLKELNTPLPKWWVYVFFATVAWAVVWCVLYPSVPWITGYFHGVLGLLAAHRGGRRRARGGGAARRHDGQDHGAVVRRDPQGSAAAWRRPKPPAASPSPTTASPAMAPAAAVSPAIRRWPPAPGSGAARSRTIQQTITYGIRSGDDKARESADAALRRRRHSEAGRDPAGRRLCDDAVRPRRAGQGRVGRQEAVRRELRRLSWRRRPGRSREGRSAAGLAASISMATIAPPWWRRSPSPRMGVMPAWHTRLDEATIKSAGAVRAFAGRRRVTVQAINGGNPPPIPPRKRRESKGDVPHQQGRSPAPAPARGGRRSSLRQPRAGLSEVGARAGAPTSNGRC